MRWLDRPASDTQVTHRQRLWLYALATIIMILLVAPTLIVIPMSFSASQYLEFPPRQWSFRWYEHYFGSPEWMQATATSLKAAFLTMLVATPVGTTKPARPSGPISCRASPAKTAYRLMSPPEVSGKRLESRRKCPVVSLTCKVAM